MPLLVSAPDWFSLSLPWVLWVASLLFMASWAWLQLRCPRIIRQYGDYGSYAAQSHSHRYVLWLFHTNIQREDSWQKLVKEATEKGLATTAPDVPEHIAQVQRERNGIKATFDTPKPDEPDLAVFYPVNHGRDLTLPLHYGGERYWITLEEKDPELSEKEKELFWILFSAAAKERPKSRRAFWVLYGLSISLYAFNLLSNVRSVISG